MDTTKEQHPPGLTITPNAITPENCAALQHWLQHDEAIPWEHAVEGRRVAQFGVRYDYQTQSVDLTPVTPLPHVLRQWLPGLTAEYTQCIVNEYSPNDSIPFHTDAPLFGPNILVFCMGEARPLLLRRQLVEDVEAKTCSLSIHHGSSYQMSGETRHMWEHAVPAGTGRRTSLTFRSLVEGAARCSRKLSRFSDMERELALTRASLEQSHDDMTARLQQLHGCEEANVALLERVQRLERGAKAAAAKERTWKRERGELRLENNKLAQQLVTLEDEVVHFMNTKGLMEGERESSRGERSGERDKRRKRKKKREKRKRNRNRVAGGEDEMSEEMCPICGERRGSCVHTKVALHAGMSGGRRGGGGGGGGEGGGVKRGSGIAAVERHDDVAVSSDDSDASSSWSKPRKKNKKKRKNKHHHHQHQEHQEHQEKEEEETDSEAEEAAYRGGKVATSPQSANSASSLLGAVSWLGSTGLSAVGSAVAGTAAWVMGEEENGSGSDNFSEYSIDSDLSDVPAAAAAVAAVPVAAGREGKESTKATISDDNRRASRGRTMLHSSSRQAEQLPTSPTTTTRDKPQAAAAAAAAAASARRMKRGQGVSDDVIKSGMSDKPKRSMAKGSGRKTEMLKPPSNAVLGMSTGLQRVVRGGGVNNNMHSGVSRGERMKKQPPMKVVRGAGF